MLRKCVYRDSRYMDFQVGKCTYDEWTHSIREALTPLVAERAGWAGLGEGGLGWGDGGVARAEGGIVRHARGWGGWVRGQEVSRGGRVALGGAGGGGGTLGFVSAEYGGFAAVVDVVGGEA